MLLCNGQGVLILSNSDAVRVWGTGVNLGDIDTGGSVAMRVYTRLRLVINCV